MNKEEKEELEKQLELAQPLSIKRVPLKTKEKFIKLAQEEFADDYGMTLKYLMDRYIDDQKYEYLVAIINRLFGLVAELEQRIKMLETKDSKPKIMTNSGEGVKR